MTTKQKVLALLLDTPDREVSGEKLARYTGVSRSAIWKAVTSLRNEGHVIEAATNRGYILRGEREIITATGINAALDTKVFGRNLEVHPVISSTNSRARELAQSGAPEGTLVVARGQTEGRGRRGRKFLSPADAGIYLSFVLRPKLPAERAVLLTAACAVAVCRAIESLADVKCGIKWVNDIFIGGKKVCGILCEGESELETGLLSYAVAGIGINVSSQEFDESIKDIATSIGNETGTEVSKNRLISEICRCMENIGDDFTKEYARRSIAAGRNVRVTEGDSVYEAKVGRVREDCALELKTPYGTRILRSGEIKILEEIV